MAVRSTFRGVSGEQMNVAADLVVAPGGAGHGVDLAIHELTPAGTQGLAGEVIAQGDRPDLY